MNPIASAHDPLFDFELKIARRADELSRHEEGGARNALDLWCQAEREILEGPWVNSGRRGAAREAAEVQHCG
jgi:hypothetical protein